MPENKNTEEFLQKLAPCIERGELEACVEEAAQLAQNVGMDAPDLLNLSTQMGEMGKYDIMYVLTLAAAQGLEGKEKALAYSNAGIAALDIGKLKESEEYYKKAIGLNPKYAEAHNNYAILFDKLSKKIEAEKHYKKAIELNPKFAEPYYNYALLLEKLGRKTEADEQFRKAIELNPKFVGLHHNYALLLEELDRKTEADEQFKKALEIDPKNVNVHNNYANFLRENARFYEAEKEVRTALQIESTYPYALGTLGDILADEGYFKEAIKEYQKSLEVVSKNPESMGHLTTSEIHNNLGWVYAQLKQYNKAGEEFKKAKSLDPENVKAIRNLRAISKINVKPEISIIQVFLGIVLLTSLFVSFDLFWIKRLTEAVFATQSSFLIAFLIFIFLYPQLTKFKAVPMEVEMSTEHRLVEAKSPPIEAFVK